MPSKRTQNSFTTIRQILVVLFIFISIVIYIFLHLIAYPYLHLDIYIYVLCILLYELDKIVKI